VSRIGGEVAPLVGVSYDVVEFFVAVGVVDVAELFAGKGEVFRAAELGESEVGPVCGGVFEKWGEVVAGEVVALGDTGEGDEGFEEVEGGDRLVTDARVIFGDHNHKGDAGAGAPAGEFLPVFFFAEMPAVVGPEDDDGVVTAG